MDNYNDKSSMEKVAITDWEVKEVTPQERNEYNEADVVLLTNWISKFNIKKHNFKRKKQKKELSIKEVRDMRLEELWLKQSFKSAMSE